MDRNKAKEILGIYEEKPIGRLPNGKVLTFARQNLHDVEAIEKMSIEELKKEWKTLVWINEIYGQVSLNEMERITLIELEMDSRNITNALDLKSWYNEAKKKFEEQEQAEGQNELEEP